MMAAPSAPPIAAGWALRPYQEAAIDAVKRASARGQRRILVSLPTGTGKTVVFSHLIDEVARAGRRCLVMVHRDELVTQTIEKLAIVAPDLCPGVVKAERDDHHASVVVASVQTLAVPSRLARVVPDFGLVVVNEAHHSSAPSWRQALLHLRCFEPDGPLTVGFSATCERSDNKHLGEVWQAVAYHMPLIEAIERGYLVDVKGIRVFLSLDLDSITIRDGDFAEGELSAALEDAHAPEHVASAYLEHAAGRKALAFFPSVQLAREAATVLNGRGVAAAAISGDTPPCERKATLEALRRGEVRVVSNCCVLTEGFDEPSVDCILMARPTKSSVLYRQVVGRALRLHPGKDDALVIDFCGATDRNGLQGLPRLFGLTEGQLGDGTVLGAVAAIRRQEEERRPDGGVLVSTPIDILERASLHWRDEGAGLYIMAVPDGSLVLEPHGDAYRVLLLQKGLQPAVLARDLPATYAQGVAEDVARRRGWAHLSGRDAAWRARPATEKQVTLLADLTGIVVGDLTAGEASDRISTFFARRQLRKWREHLG